MFFGRYGDDSGGDVVLTVVLWTKVLVVVIKEILNMTWRQVSLNASNIKRES